MANKSIINNQFKSFIFSKINPLNLIKPQKVVIDFSSPNIAKPFHPGHLRATLLGNFIANINRVFGHKVYGINYLGDWGTQFGFLLHGLNALKNNINIEKMTIEDLYDVYVRSNKEFGKKDHVIKSITTKLENGDEDLLEKWMSLRSFSVDNLQRVYKRLGIKFDSFEYESDYVKKSKDLAYKLELENKFVSYHDGALCYVRDNVHKVILLTSEGSSLYITRDIAAAISRFHRYHPDRIHYVVENGQSSHFENLRGILTDLGYTMEDKSKNLIPKDFHVKFGRVNNMSTRAGNVIFLDDILDHAKSLMIERLNNIEKITLTAQSDLQATCEELGKTLIFCEFLRPPRQNSFNFLWNRDNVGFRLQYCQICLSSLERRCAEFSIEPDLNDCFETDNYKYFRKFRFAAQLVEHILKFDQVLLQSYLECESCYLMQYITKMTGLVNSSLKELNVINCVDKSEAKCRLKLFSVSKFVLQVSFEILGIPILYKI